MRGDDALLLLHAPEKKPPPSSALTSVDKPENVEDLAESPAHRPVNLRFLILLIVAAVALSGGVWALHRHQMHSMAATLLERSEQARRDGDLERAVEHLRGYRQLVPEDVKALGRLAYMLDQAAETPRQRFAALSLFEELLRREQDTPEIRRKLVDLSMTFGRFGDAIAHLQVLLNATPQDSELYLLLGRCHEGNRNPAQAAADYEAAIRFNPRAFEAYERLVDLLRNQLDRRSDADRVLGRMIAANPQSFDAYLLRARTHQTDGRIRDALLDARRAWQLAPDEPDVLVLAADLVASERGGSEAQTYLQADEIYERLQAAVEELPSDVRLHRALANLDLADGRTGSAEQHLRHGLEQDANDTSLRWLLADVLIERQEYDAARAEIAELRRRKAADALIGYLESRLSLVQGDWLAARKGFELTRAGNAGDAMFKSAVNLYLARCYRELGQFELESDAFRRALQHQPGSVEAQVGLATALAKIGRLEEAFVQYQPVKHVPGAAIAAARLAIQRNLRTAVQQRDWAGVEQLLDQAARDQSSQAEALVVRAELRMAQGEPEQARELLQTAVERQPGQVMFWLALADLESRTSGHAEAAALLDRADEQLGQRVELYLTRVQLATRASEDADKRLDGLSARADEFASNDRPAIARAFALAYEEIGRNAEALRHWNEAAELEPNDLAVHTRILELAIRTENVELASSSLKEIQRLEGTSGSGSRLAEAACYMLRARRGERQMLARARQLIEGAQRVSIGSPVQVQLALAELSELEGNDEAAVEHYRAAVDAGERDPRIVRRAAQLLYARHRFFDAENLIKKYQEQSPEAFSGGLGRFAAELSLRTRDRARAIELARQSVSETSAEFQDHLWLGQLLMVAGQAGEAETALQKARDLAPSRPEVWVASAHLYSRNGQPERISELLEAARKHVPAELLPLTLAQCYEAAGETERAAEAYAQVLGSNPDDPSSIWAAASFHLRQGDLERSEPLLRQLVAMPPETTRGSLAPARRALSVTLAARGTYPNFAEALGLLEQNLQGDGAAPEDLRVKARLLATRSERRRQAEAISILETLDERSPLTPDDQRLLIQLYLAIDDWEQARRWLQALLAAQSNDPDVLAFAIRTMIDNGEAEGAAQQWLVPLKSLQPQAQRTAELETRLLVGQGRDEEALQLLRQQIPNENPDAPEALDRIIRAAQVIADLSLRQERLGRTASAELLAAEAEKLLRRTIEHRPDQALVLARFLGQCWRTDEALALCDTAWQSLPAERVASTCVDVLRSGRATQEQFQRVRARLESAATAAPSSAELHFQLANVAHLQGDYTSAERLYRRTLELSPGSVITLNELALLLALNGGQTEEALRLIDRAVDAAGPLPFLLDTRATVYLSAGQHAAAIKDLRDAIADAPSAAKHFHLAQALLARDDAAAAKAELRRGVAAGLHAGSLHPLERTAYEQTVSTIDKL